MGTLNAIFGNTLFLTLTQSSLSERLEVATLNTVLGIVTVFSVLILLIILIYMFRIFPYIENLKKDKQVDISSSPEPVIISDNNAEPIKLTDDLELVAVITAAISASLGEAVPSDGLIIRSIRKVNKRR